MKHNQLKLGAALSYLQMAISVLIGLIYTPIMIRLLGTSEYGLYNTVSSTISALSILNLGFNSGYIRYYAKYKEEKNDSSFAHLNALFLIIFLIIGFVAFLCGLYLTINLDLVFDQGLTNTEYEIARVLMFLLTLNLAISFPMSVFANIISAHERYVFLKLTGLLRTIVSPLVSLPILLMGYRSVALVCVSVSLSLLCDLFHLIYVLRVLKCPFHFRHLDCSVLSDLFSYTAFIAIGLVVDQINWNVDKILLGRFCGTASVAVYSVGFTIYGYYQMFSTSVSGVFTPRIHQIVNATKTDLSEQRIQLTQLFTKVGRIQFFLLSLVSSGFVFFGKPFIVCFWAGAEYERAYYVALLLMLPASIALIQNTGIEIQRALNKHRFRSFAYSIMALFNLIISIYLCQIYGEIGSAIGTALSLIVANGLIINFYYHFKCNIDMHVFWRNILSASRGLAVPLSFGFILIRTVDMTHPLRFTFSIICYSLVYCASIWSFGMNKFEQNLIRTPLITVWRKQKNAR